MLFALWREFTHATVDEKELDTKMFNLRNAIIATQRAISTNDVPTRSLEQKPGDLATERRLKFYKGLLGLLHGLVTGD